MKLTLIFLFLTINSICFAQFKPLLPSKAVLKSGDTLSGIRGKLKNQSFKYKRFSAGKAIEIEFSEIEFIQIRYSKNDIKTYKNFQLEDGEMFLAVRPSVLGSRVELYFRERFISYNGAGGIVNSGTIAEYYIRKIGEEKLTNLGYYNVFGSMRKNVLNFFSDCNPLVEKIENRSFKMRDGLEDVVKYYNKSCE